jgi:hypothetical protein
MELVLSTSKLMHLLHAASRLKTELPDLTAADLSRPTEVSSLSSATTNQTHAAVLQKVLSIISTSATVPATISLLQKLNMSGEAPAPVPVSGDKILCIADLEKAASRKMTVTARGRYNVLGTAIDWRTAFLPI